MKGRGAVVEEDQYDVHCVDNGKALDNNEMKAREVFYNRARVR